MTPSLKKKLSARLQISKNAPDGFMQQ